MAVLDQSALRKRWSGKGCHAATHAHLATSLATFVAISLATFVATSLAISSISQHNPDAVV